MPEFRVIKGGADSKARRKSVASSKRVTEDQKKAANAAQEFGSLHPAAAKADGFPSSDTVNYAAEPESAAAAAVVEEPSATPAGHRARPSVASKGKVAKAIGVFAAVLAVLLIALLGAFAAYRWLYGNDGLDIQGSWYVNGSEAVMTFTDTEIILNDEVSYSYAINAANKTISYDFNDLHGAGSYRFSLDRGELAIIDGEPTSLETLKADFVWLLSAFVQLMKGEEALPAPADAAGVTLLVRVPVDPSFDSGGEGEDAAGEGQAGEDGAESEGEDPSAGDGLSADSAEPVEPAAPEGDAEGDIAGSAASKLEEEASEPSRPGSENEFAQPPGSSHSDIASLSVSDAALE